MPQITISADAEQALIDELTPYAPAIGTGIPAGSPAQFVRVLQVGGTQRNLVTDTPTLTLEVFDYSSESAARELAVVLLGVAQHSAVKGTMGGVPCYRVQTVSLPQNYPLPSLPNYFRYIATIAPDLRRRVEIH